MPLSASDDLSKIPSNSENGVETRVSRRGHHGELKERARLSAWLLRTLSIVFEYSGDEGNETELLSREFKNDKCAGRLLFGPPGTGETQRPKLGNSELNLEAQSGHLRLSDEDQFELL